MHTTYLQNISDKFKIFLPLNNILGLSNLIVITAEKQVYKDLLILPFKGDKGSLKHIVC